MYKIAINKQQEHNLIITTLFSEPESQSSIEQEEHTPGYGDQEPSVHL